MARTAAARTVNVWNDRVFLAEVDQPVLRNLEPPRDLRPT